MPKLCVMPGDGIGKEVIPAAVQILQAVIPDLETVFAPAGWETFEQTGASVPESTLETIRACGAGLFGAVQSPTGGKVDGYRSAILTMRQALNLYANIRPIISIPHITPRNDVDMIIFRENTEGLYSGRERMEDNKGDVAIAERVITAEASRNIASAALTVAQQAQRNKITIVHKANVLPVTDGLFRQTVREVVDGSGMEIDELLIDVACLKMVSDPTRFDVVVTTNLFGDILSDAAAHWAGGLGFAPSININLNEGIAVAEPVHGSAPDIARQGMANPIAAILSGALLARYVWGNDSAANLIEQAVKDAVAAEPSLVETRPGATEAITAAIISEIS